MASLNRILISVSLGLIGIFFYINYNLKILFTYLVILILLEFFFYALIINLRKKFPWLITPKDEVPVIDPFGLNKFMKHGFDPELGWVRKPNTYKKEIGKEGSTKYHINEKGSRQNPGHEALPEEISCYGDSFTFSRQVNDNETWEWYLSKLTKTNVLNFGIGNHGLDQALLRLKREYPKNKTKIAIMGVVPSTIVRIMCLWKHYNEFGNTFAFKPMFKINENQLVLVKNIINSKDKFLELGKYLDYFRKNDYFYNVKFREEMIRPSYLISTLSHPVRNFRLIGLTLWSRIFEKDKDKKMQVYDTPMKVIMDVNLKLRYKLFKKNKYTFKLIVKLVEEFVDYSKQQGFTPIFLFMPQKDDVLFINKKKDYYYSNFIKTINDKLLTIDLTKDLLRINNLNALYSGDTKYGGHYSKEGNKFVAEKIYENLKENKII